MLIAVLAWTDTSAVARYVSLLDASGTVSADSLPFVRPIPADYADAQTWARYAVSLQERGGWRLAHTDIDNAPRGRDVYWNAAFAHLVSLGGRVQRALADGSLARATESALAWLNLPLFLAVVVLFSTLVARRAGTEAGVLVSLGMLGHRWFYLGFAPNYVDHHGLLTAATFGVVLGATFMGAGWWRAAGGGLLPRSPSEARNWAIVSAVSGAVGLWISAASTIPVVAMVGIAGLVAGWRRGAAERDARFDATVWRIWGWTGACVALVAYAAEYAPRFPLRLEVNHPLYALAWAGGAEAVALLVERTTTGRRMAWARLTVAVAAVLAPVATLAVVGTRAFVPLDPRVSRLHAGIGEFMSLAALARAAGEGSMWRYAVGFVLAVPAPLAFRRRQRDSLLLAFTGTIVVLYVALACWQMRWWLGASAAELCLLIVAADSVASSWSTRSRWALVGAIGTAFVAQAVSRVLATQRAVDTRTVESADAMQPLYRDIAATLRASQPRGPIVLLASPNASAGIAYFGGFETLGTLYWENVDGLSAAAAIFSARTDEDARALLAARRVTHIALVSKNDFLRGYFAFAEPNSPSDAISRTFGYRLTSGLVPRWLRLVPLKVRPGAPSSVSLFQIVPDQSDFKAAWSVGEARLEMGQTRAAERALRTAIALAPDARRSELYQTAATIAYRSGAHDVALRFYASALDLAPTTTIKANMAWILATSADDRVRDGRAALAIAEPLASTSPRDAIVLDSYAAALAEVGRFADAVNVARRMEALAGSSGDAALASRAESRAQSYAAGRPWRN